MRQDQEFRARAEAAKREADIRSPALKRLRHPQVKHKGRVTSGKVVDWLLVVAVVLTGLALLVFFVVIVVAA